MTREEHKQLFINITSKSEEEINAICDCGVFNDIIKGYAIAAMEQAGFSIKDIQRLDFYHVFDAKNAFEARGKVKEYKQKCLKVGEQRCAAIGCNRVGTIEDKAEIAPGVYKNVKVCMEHKGQLMENIQMEGNYTI